MKRDIKKDFSLVRWSDADIEKTHRIIQNVKKNKPPHIRRLERLSVWISLAVAIIGNFVITVALVPVLMALQSFALYLTLIIAGLSFGSLFEIMLRHVEYTDKKFHIWVGMLLFIAVAFNFTFIAKFSNQLIQPFMVQNQPHNPWLVGFVYTIAFVAPYFFFKVVKK